MPRPPAAAFVFPVIAGGMPAIASATPKLVPEMAVTYIGMSIAVIVMNLSQVGPAIALIFDGAFSAQGVAGGFVGALIQGLKRATFSNEACIGSAAIAHTAVKTEEPVTEGRVSLLEPFIDTVVICTMTALVLTIAGLNVGPYPSSEGLPGVNLTAASFQATADWFRDPLAVAVLLFAVSMMISWSYYGLKGWTYLFGDGSTNELVYKLMFCAFVGVGCSIGFSAVIDFSDAAVYSMGILNIVGLHFLMPVAKRGLALFLAKVESGELKRFG